MDQNGKEKIGHWQMKEDFDKVKFTQLNSTGALEGNGNAVANSTSAEAINTLIKNSTKSTEIFGVILITEDEVKARLESMAKEKARNIKKETARRKRQEDTSGIA